MYIKQKRMDICLISIYYINPDPKENKYNC